MITGVLTSLRCPDHHGVPPYRALIPVDNEPLRSYSLKVNSKAAYPADASYGRCLHGGAVREHLVMVTPKQMHLVSDPNNRQSTFPVSSSAHTLGSSRHYSHRPVTRSLLYTDGAPRPHCRLRTPHFVLLNPVRIVPASKPRPAVSTDVCAPQ